MNLHSRRASVFTTDAGNCKLLTCGGASHLRALAQAQNTRSSHTRDPASSIPAYRDFLSLKRLADAAGCSDAPFIWVEPPPYLAGRQDNALGDLAGAGHEPANGRLLPPEQPRGPTLLPLISATVRPC